MKIFLHERTIEILPSLPGDLTPRDLVTGDLKRKVVAKDWMTFLSDLHRPRWIITDPESGPGSPGAAAALLQSLFTLVPAAGGLVGNEQGQYLFIHRLGHWDLPKGKVDKHDRREAGRNPDGPSADHIAALREVNEETGLVRLKIVKELEATRHIYNTGAKWCLKTTRWFLMRGRPDDPLKPQTSEHIDWVEWINKEDLPEILPGTYASIRELVGNFLH